MAKKGRKAGVVRGTVRRSIEQDFKEIYDEMFSQQTETVSAAIVEAYKSQNLVQEYIVMGEEIIAQGRYWHGL